jgi:hypothetical protein
LQSYLYRRYLSDVLFHQSLQPIRQLASHDQGPDDEESPPAFIMTEHERCVHIDSAGTEMIFLARRLALHAFR